MGGGGGGFLGRPCWKPYCFHIHNSVPLCQANHPESLVMNKPLCAVKKPQPTVRRGFGAGSVGTHFIRFLPLPHPPLSWMAVLTFHYSSEEISGHSHAPTIRSHRGRIVVWQDFQPMRVPEEPVCIDLFRKNPVFTPCIWNLPFMSYRLNCL